MPMSRDDDSANKTAAVKPPPRATRTRAIVTVTAGDLAGRVVPLGSSDAVTLGRSDDCDVRFDDGSLSRVHARLKRVAGEVVLMDLDSTNGTWVNDERVDFARALKDGDRIRLGTSTKLRFTLVDDLEEQALRSARGLAERLRASGEEEDLKEDLLEARDFQRGSLVDPPAIAGVEIETVYRPLGLVGGDLYHFHLLRDRSLRVFLADATGHGVRASLTTMLILGEYEYVKARAGGPASVLLELNDRIASTYAHLEVRFTAVCIDLHFDAGLVRHASAAHPAPMLVRGGGVRELEAGGTFMGLVPGVRFPEHEAALEAGDKVVAFTDGVVEVFDARGAPFGEDRLAAALRGAAGHDAALGAAAMRSVAEFLGPDRPLSDDATIITIHFQG
jgi:serine phosphatase RsbU (regulator of sigma subunit)